MLRLGGEVFGVLRFQGEGNPLSAAGPFQIHLRGGPGAGADGGAGPGQAPGARGVEQRRRDLRSWYPGSFLRVIPGPPLPLAACPWFLRGDMEVFVPGQGALCPTC